MTPTRTKLTPEKCWNCYGFGYVMVSTGNTVTPHRKFPCPYCRPQTETLPAEPAPPQGALVRRPRITASSTGTPSARGCAVSKRDVRDAFDRAVLTGFYEAGEPWIEPWCEDHLAQGDPDCHACIAASHDAWMHRAKAVEAENTRLRELYENAVANRRQFGWTIDHLLECEEALRVAQAELAKHEAVLVAADRVYTAYQAMLDGENIGRLPEWEK